MKEIRRRSKVVGSFPDGYSAIISVGAGLRHISTTKWGNMSVSLHLQNLRTRCNLEVIVKEFQLLRTRFAASLCDFTCSVKGTSA